LNYGKDNFWNEIFTFRKEALPFLNPRSTSVVFNTFVAINNKLINNSLFAMYSVYVDIMGSDTIPVVNMTQLKPHIVLRGICWICKQNKIILSATRSDRKS
jgi:hypothetical protein